MLVASSKKEFAPAQSSKAVMAFPGPCWSSILGSLSLSSSAWEGHPTSDMPFFEDTRGPLGQSDMFIQPLIRCRQPGAPGCWAAARTIKHFTSRASELTPGEAIRSACQAFCSPGSRAVKMRPAQQGGPSTSQAWPRQQPSLTPSCPPRAQSCRIGSERENSECGREHSGGVAGGGELRNRV